MLDLQFVCENLEAVKTNCRHRGVAIDLSRLTALRELRSKLIVEGDNLRRGQKELSAQIPKTKDADEKQTL
ncbi:MAG TPA: serine--tRNA ligase, partial [Planctomycetaceae bacterium]|nr:serine--tRNA ligase [Planctomycetaceae bacterium]